MSTAVEPRHPQSGELDRAISAIHWLERSGLGQLEWLGPVWTGVLSDIDWRGLDFLSIWVAQNSRLRRSIRNCQSQSERQRIQMGAIFSGLKEYSRVSGRASGVNLRFLAHEFERCHAEAP